MAQVFSGLRLSGVEGVLGLGQLGVGFVLAFWGLGFLGLGFRV